MADERQVPIQLTTGSYNHLPHPLVIPWWLHELIYAGYHKLYGNAQTAERLAERGGFETYEALTLLRDLGPDGIRDALAAPTEGDET
jgi:hypothetical protein